MSKLRVAGYTISIDGYGAGPNQSRENPLGEGGESLHDWMVRTRTFQKGKSGETGPDDDLVARAMANNGAWIMGRNMFGPIRGPWPDASWKGWWGDNPPYHTPVYVLTHHPREPLEMAGGTTFYFVTAGIHAALEQARDVANGKDIRLLGGASTIRQYLQANLVDEVHLAVSPIVLGSGEHLLDGINLLQLGLVVTERISTERALHVVLSKG